MAPLDEHPQQVHQYHDQSTALHGGLARYYNTRLFSDLTVVAPDGRRLLCHQLVLSACSKRFAAMLEEGALQGKELPVHGVNSGALERIIHFFYTGECTLTVPTAIAILDTSKRLDVPGLTAACEAYVHTALSQQTACSLLTESLHFHAEQLVDVCLGFIGSRFDEVAASNDFLSCPFPTLACILEAPAISQEQPDMALFKAAMAWLLADISHAQHLQPLLKLVKGPTGDCHDLMSLARAAGGGAKSEVQQKTGVSHRNGSNARVLDLSDVGGGGGAPSGLQPGGLDLGGSSSEAAGNLAPVSSVASALAGAGMSEGLHALQQALAAAPGLPLLGLDVGVGERSAVDNESQLRALLAAATRGQQQPPPQQEYALPPLPPRAGSVPDAAWGNASSGAVPAVSAPQHDLLPRLPLTPSFPGAGYPHATGAAGAELGCRGQPQPRAAAYAHYPPEGVFDRHEDAHGQVEQQQQQQQQRHGGYRRSESGAEHEGGSPRDGQDSPTGRGSGRGGGSHMHRTGASKNVCQVEGCSADLRGLRDYHVRYKICEHHLKISSILKDGKAQRFCQQCGRFHLLTDFDGNKRSCRARLQRHNARRRKRPGEEEVLASPSAKRPRGISSNGGSGMDDDDMDEGMDGGMGAGMGGAGMRDMGGARGMHGGVGGVGGGMNVRDAGDAGMRMGGGVGSMGSHAGGGQYGSSVGRGALPPQHDQRSGRGSVAALDLGGLGHGTGGSSLGSGKGSGGGALSAATTPEQFMQAIRTVAEQQGLDPGALPQMLLRSWGGGNAPGVAANANGTSGAGAGEGSVSSTSHLHSSRGLQLDLGSPRNGSAATGFGAFSAAGGFHGGPTAGVGSSGATQRRVVGAMPLPAAAGAGNAGSFLPGLLALPGMPGAAMARGSGLPGSGGLRSPNCGLDILANVAQQRKEQAAPITAVMAADDNDAAEEPLVAWGPKGKRSGARRTGSDGHTTPSPKGSAGSEEHTSQVQQGQQQQQQQQQQGEEMSRPQGNNNQEAAGHQPHSQPPAQSSSQPQQEHAQQEQHGDSGAIKQQNAAAAEGAPTAEMPPSGQETLQTVDVCAHGGAALPAAGQAAGH